MTKYESEIKILNKPQELVYELLSDLNNLKHFQESNLAGKEQIEAYLQGVEISPDAIKVQATGIGEIAFRIVEREANKTIKFEAENSPIAANAWIQLLPLSNEETKMKVTIKAELPMMLRVMLNSKLEKGVNMLADAISSAINKQ